MGKRFTVFTLAFFLLCILMGGCDDAASLRWTRLFAPDGGWGFIEGFDMAVDVNGNSYMTGMTMGNMDDQTLTGEVGAYVVKYDRTGQRLWTRMLCIDAEEGGVIGEAIALDGAGNLYITGSTNGEIDGQGTIGDPVTESHLFIAKYTCDGEKLWAKDILPEGDSEGGNSIAIDGAGNLFIAGTRFVTPDDTGLNDKTYILVSKFDSAGTLIWTYEVGEAGEVGTRNRITLDKAGNCYMTGTAYGSIGGDVREYATAFITKISASGSCMWLKLVKSEGAETFGSGITLDRTGNCIVSGTTNGGIDDQALNGYSDAFMVKYGPSGSRKWTRLLGSPDIDTGSYSVAVDMTGNIYLAGPTSGSIDGQKFYGYCDAFTAKYNASGARLWIKLLGANDASDTITDPRDIALDALGAIYMFGRTDGSLDGASPSGSLSMFITTMFSE